MPNPNDVPLPPVVPGALPITAQQRYEELLAAGGVRERVEALHRAVQNRPANPVATNALPTAQTGLWQFTQPTDAVSALLNRLTEVITYYRTAVANGTYRDNPFNPHNVTILGRYLVVDLEGNPTYAPVQTWVPNTLGTALEPMVGATTGGAIQRADRPVTITDQPPFYDERIITGENPAPQVAGPHPTDPGATRNLGGNIAAPETPAP